eukprot:239345-Pyramimonas_sp.AAC.1
MLEACRLTAGQPEGMVEPLVFFRMRKYDGTRMKLTCNVEHDYGEDVITERTKGTRETFVTKAGFGIAVRKRARQTEEYLHMCGQIPTHLCVLQGSKAEVINAALHVQVDSSYDSIVEGRFPRQVDIIGCDAASGNLRNERARAHMKKESRRA